MTAELHDPSVLNLRTSLQMPAKANIDERRCRCGLLVVWTYPQAKFPKWSPAYQQQTCLSAHSSPSPLDITDGPKTHGSRSSKPITLPCRPHFVDCVGTMPKLESELRSPS